MTYRRPAAKPQVTGPAVFMGCMVIVAWVIGCIICFCASILASGLLVYLLWLLGRFLIG